MASNFDGLARMIVQNVGGRDNVAGLTFGNGCLIFDLKDDGRANTAVMESIGGISEVRKQPGKYIVGVEGPAKEIYEAVCERGQIVGNAEGSSRASDKSSGAGSIVLRYLVGVIVAFVVAWFAMGAFSPDSAAGVRLGIGACAAVVASVLSYFLFGDRKKAHSEKTAEKEARTIISHDIGAPLAGTLIALEEIPDEAFASGLLGKGLGIVPSEGKLYAPCDGEISTFFPTGHAIGIASSGGADLLMHVGLGTVALNGDGFKPKMKQGDTCRKGDLLLEFDIKKIEKEGLSPVTPLIITNSDAFSEVKVASKEQVQMGEDVLMLRK
ncbi:MAG: PTS glucose transporter subunit IIA [Lachnospiraceae bacterium]|nr:PTS glucose transporter subunit IIA [Lachnospiraceae bacterium]